MGLIVMLNDMVLNISDFGPIDEANIEIGRINVVVGKTVLESPHLVKFCIVF